MHSCFVTEVGIYKDAGIQATSTENSRVKPYNSGIVDAKLQQFFERASSELREKRDTSDESSIRHRLIDDGERELLDFLEGQPTRIGFRYAQWANMGVLPPMTAKKDGQWRAPMVFDRWEQSEEDMRRKANGKVDLNQGNGSTTGNVAYNPYFHIRTSPLNDQFTAAYRRPELIVVEGEYPESELTSGYRAEGAKDPVGLLNWHAGGVNGQLAEGTKVQTMLSRYFKPGRIVPWGEVADRIMDTISGQSVTFPINVVPPMLRYELARRGVKFGPISGSVAKKDIPMLSDLIERINGGEYDAGLEGVTDYVDAYNSSSEAKERRVGELSQKLGVPVRVISDPSEIASLPWRMRHSKGWWDGKKGEDPKKSENVIVGLNNNGKHFLVGVHFNQTRRGVEVSDIRGLFPKENAEWLNWISQGKSKWLDKERIQTLIDQQRTNLAEVEYLDLDSVAKVIKTFVNPTIEGGKKLRYGDGSDVSWVSEADSSYSGARFRDGDALMRLVVHRPSP